jgi:hypothetical protein
VEKHLWHYSLDNLLQSIIAPKDNKEASNRRILLILDSLDEYINNSQKSLIHKLDELRNRYPNIKTMITTRLEDKILDKQGFKNVDKYVRLLSFTNEQVDDFFRNYEVTIEGIQLTYERAKELNLPVEEMTTPLFAWIFSYLEMHTSRV